MAPLDGTILTKMNIKHPQMPDNNISKAQPSKAKGLGGVRFQGQKMLLLYIYIDNSTDDVGRHDA